MGEQPAVNAQSAGSEQPGPDGTDEHARGQDAPYGSRDLGDVVLFLALLGGGIVAAIALYVAFLWLALGG